MFQSIFAYVCPACFFIALHLAANNDLNISPSFPIIDSFRHCLWLQSQRKRPTPERRRVWTHRLGSATAGLDLLILRGSNNEDYSLEIPRNGGFPIRNVKHLSYPDPSGSQTWQIKNLLGKADFPSHKHPFMGHFPACHRLITQVNHSHFSNVYHWVN